MRNQLVNVGVLGSGGGTNCQAIVDACALGGVLYGLERVAVIISNNSQAGILERSRTAGSPD